MKKHITNEHDPNLVKYTVHKISLEGKDSNKKKNGKNKVSIMLTAIIVFFGGVRPYKKSNPI